MSTEHEIQEDGQTEHPLWRKVASDLLREGVSYGQVWPAEFFEQRLRCGRNSNEFKFSMIQLRQHPERNGSYYVASEGNGALWRVIESPENEDMAQTFERRMRRLARRSVAIRVGTLANPKAQLTDSQRSTMERNAEHASIRLALIHRSSSIAQVVKQHAPKLLTGKEA